MAQIRHQIEKRRMWNCLRSCLRGIGFGTLAMLGACPAPSGEDVETTEVSTDTSAGPGTTSNFSVTDSEAGESISTASSAEGPNWTSSSTGDGCRDDEEFIGDLVLDDRSTFVFECLVRIDGSLTIGPSTSLVAPLPLDRLREVTGDVVISGNSGLDSLQGMGALERVGGRLEISENSVLTTVAALTALQELSELSLLNDPVLADAGLFASSVHLVGNSEGWTALSFAGLPSLADLDGLAHVKDVTIDGSLYVTIDNNSMLDDIGGIVPFLRAGTADLRLTDLPSLVALDLEGVTAFGNLHASQLMSLQSVAGLADVETMRAMKVYDAPSLASLAGLDQLKTVEDSLSIGGCDTLGSPTGLVSMEGLGALTSVGELEVAGQQELVTLSGLSTVVDIGLLSVRNNTLLSSDEVNAYAATVMPQFMETCGNAGDGPCQREGGCDVPD